MKTLVAVALLCGLLQEKAPVTIVPDPPTEAAWPISGRVVRPNGTVVKVLAVRIERHWEPTQDRFREFAAARAGFRDRVGSPSPPRADGQLGARPSRPEVAPDRPAGVDAQGCREGREPSA